VLGNGPQRIACIGSLHGDEPQSVGLVDELHRCLKQNLEYLENSTVLLIKSPNPDGLALDSAQNAHGVDLNHNFPAPNWKPLDRQRAGTKPNSEKETQAVVKMLVDFQPHLLVHLKDSRGSGFVNYEGAAKNQAEQLAQALSCQVIRGRGEKTTGSIESYARTQLSCPSLTLLLPREETDEAAWKANGGALLGLLKSPATQTTGHRGTPAKRANSLQSQPLRRSPGWQPKPRAGTHSQNLAIRGKIHPARLSAPGSGNRLPGIAPSVTYLSPVLGQTSGGVLGGGETRGFPNEQIGKMNRLAFDGHT
jgi:Zinc carboxypeptidase